MSAPRALLHLKELPMLLVLLIRLTDNEPDSTVPPLIIRRFPCIIGRHSTCHRRLSDAAISRRHCVLTLQDGRIYVEDLGSVNGTRLNAEPVVSPRPLVDGDRLLLADLCFLVRLADERGDEAVELGEAVEGTDDPTGRKLG
jgi:pSer/pThr/pTyr-binding forkhead associated (FHA) protein